MSEMVERVALAICAENGEEWEEAGVMTSGGVVTWRQNGYRGLARAAIAAMREPTEAMLEFPCPLSKGEMRVVWWQMIDAALADSKTQILPKG